MSIASSMLVRFWGVRGTLPAPGTGTVRYGGNTSCVEVRCGGRTLIFDAGSGIRKLGDALLAQGGNVDADILFSHCHLDHILGIPFFAPFYMPGHEIRLWAGNLLPASKLETVIGSIMDGPLFPIGTDMFKAQIRFCDFRAGDVLNLDNGIVVRTGALNHPGGAVGYRLDFQGRSVAYLTDTEHRAGELDTTVFSLAKGADLMIYDCTYTDDEFANYVGWGHSTWQHAVQLADAAGVKQVGIFHHDPDHDDAFLDGVQMAAQGMRAGTFVAREGMELRL